MFVSWILWRLPIEVSGRIVNSRLHAPHRESERTRQMYFGKVAALLALGLVAAVVTVAILATLLVAAGSSDSPPGAAPRGPVEISSPVASPDPQPTPFSPTSTAAGVTASPADTASNTPRASGTALPTQIQSSASPTPQPVSSPTPPPTSTPSPTPLPTSTPSPTQGPSLSALETDYLNWYLYQRAGLTNVISSINSLLAQLDNADGTWALGLPDLRDAGRGYVATIRSRPAPTLRSQASITFIHGAMDGWDSALDSVGVITNLVLSRGQLSPLLQPSLQLQIQGAFAIYLGAKNGHSSWNRRP